MVCCWWFVVIVGVLVVLVLVLVMHRLPYIFVECFPMKHPSLASVHSPLTFNLAVFDLKNFEDNLFFSAGDGLFILVGLLVLGGLCVSLFFLLVVLLLFLT